MSKYRQTYLIVLTGIVVMGILPCLAQPVAISTFVEQEGRPVTVEVTTGKHWEHSFRIVLVKVTTTPQLAIWTEDLEGNVLSTLYVTQSFATQQWSFAGGQKDDQPFRPASLPYWMHKYAASGGQIPTKNTPLPDAVTAASPKQNFVLRSKLPVGKSTIALLLEVNNSVDKNSAFPEDQPALVYRAIVRTDAPGEYSMQPIGHAHPTGADGTLTEDLSGLTTALQMLEQITVSVE
jgi:hypothetical protein